jgi:hypothetical protein
MMLKKRTTSLMMSALALVMVTGAAAVAANETHELCEGFVPQNKLQIPVGQKGGNRFSTKAAGGITEVQFNEVMDRIERLYAPVIAQKGGKLKLNRKWTDPTVNASAQQQGGMWILNMYGGLARHTEIGVEGMALVACHELGHHIGGAPKIEGWFSTWATNEGGSDYFATLKCLRNYFAEDDNETIINAQAPGVIEPMMKDMCEKEFTQRKDQLLCLRGAIAGAQVAGLFMDLNKDKVRPSVTTPDKTIVTEMDDNHPATQCRMDTYFAGAVCNVDATVENSNSDYKQGSCVEGVATVGWRPRCWFFPSDSKNKPDQPKLPDFPEWPLY